MNPLRPFMVFKGVFLFNTSSLKKKTTARFPINNNPARSRDFTFKIGVALGMSLSK